MNETDNTMDELDRTMEQMRQKRHNKGLGYIRMYPVEQFDFYVDGKPVSMEQLEYEFGEKKVQDMMDDLEKMTTTCHNAIGEVSWSISEYKVTARF